MYMTHLSPEQNERLRQEMERVISQQFGTRAELARAMGISAASLSDLLNRKGGASLETAELFAQRIARRPTEEIIGKRAVALVAVPRAAPPRPERGYQISAEVRRQATVLLMQPPQKFTADAIAIGFECIVMRTATEAANPAAVAEAVRLAILGTAASLPVAPPSDAPPAGTRRSRRRAL